MKKVFRFVMIFILSGIVFFVLTVLSHQFFEVFTVSEVRLSAVLYPFLGISYGLPAALGIMIANYASDVINGYPPQVLVLSMVAQFVYTMAPRIIWRWFVKNDEHKHRLDSVKRVLQFAFVCFVSAFLAANYIGYMCWKLYGLNFMQVAIFVFLNNFEISIIFGCPLMIIANQIVSRDKCVDRTFSTNEKIIIVTAIIEVVVLFALVFIMYSHSKRLGTYDIWNTIYYYAVGFIGALFIISLIVMIAFEKMK